MTLGRLLLPLLFCALAAGPVAAETPTLRIALLKFGTVNWLVDTIQSSGLDKAEGYRLEDVPLAGKAATTIAFQSGDVDLMVTDWFWVMLMREDGLDYRFFPYSKSLGAMMGTRDGPAKICDLKGKDIGVVGGHLDKSWLVLQALTVRDCGFNIAKESQALFGAPPIMNRQLEDGAVDAVVTYWPFAARLEAAGYRPLMEVSDALAALGITPPPALIGFVWDGDRTDADLIEAFRRSVAAAAEMLRTDMAEWERLRPLMRAQTDAEFTQLRDRYRAGVTSRWTTADTEAARGILEVLAKAGGEEFMATTGRFDAGAFPADDR